SPLDHRDDLLVFSFINNVAHPAGNLSRRRRFGDGRADNHSGQRRLAQPGEFVQINAPGEVNWQINLLDERDQPLEILLLAGFVFLETAAVETQRMNAQAPQLPSPLWNAGDSQAVGHDLAIVAPRRAHDALNDLIRGATEHSHDIGARRKG